MSARKRILASKRGDVASTFVSRTVELEGVLGSYRSAMKGVAGNHLRYNSGAASRKLRSDAQRCGAHPDLPCCLSHGILSHHIDQSVAHCIRAANLFGGDKY